MERGGVARTVMDRELVATWVGVDESVAVSFTVNDWAALKVWVTELPLPVVPSPKFQVTA